MVIILVNRVPFKATKDFFSPPPLVPSRAPRIDALIKQFQVNNERLQKRLKIDGIDKSTGKELVRSSNNVTAQLTIAHQQVESLTDADFKSKQKLSGTILKRQNQNLVQDCSVLRPCMID